MNKGSETPVKSGTQVGGVRKRQEKFVSLTSSSSRHAFSLDS